MEIKGYVFSHVCGRIDGALGRDGVSGGMVLLESGCYPIFLVGFLIISKFDVWIVFIVKFDKKLGFSIKKMVFLN